jgi:hypothetical protein
LGLPDPDPLVRDMDPYPARDPDPDPSIIMQTLITRYYFATLFDFFSSKMILMYLQKVISRKNCVKKFVFCWHLEGQ